MRRSELFTKTTKNVPSDETSINAKLLIRAGYIHKEMAGVYAYLPLGLITLEKITSVIREEMNKLEAQEIIMTNLQSPELWQKTDRWDDKKVDIWFKTKLKNTSEIGLAWSHEEPVVDMMRSYIFSFRDLPVSVYQFQTKLRNELRAKSGILRGREFIMKDLYSFSADEEMHKKLYDKLTDAYIKVFNRLGLGDRTYLTYASGGAFTKYSHEFQTLTQSGEDTIYISQSKKLAVNKEVYGPEVLKQLGLTEAELKQVTASEVANIFSFGDSKSKDIGLFYSDKHGKQQPVILGSGGIGVTRLMGVIAEVFSDTKGLVWPEIISPKLVYLIVLGDDKQALKTADELYNSLTVTGIEVIYDDRLASAGEKFADADLMGIPYRVVVSERNAKDKVFELKHRTQEKSEIITKPELIKRLAKIQQKLV